MRRKRRSNTAFVHVHWPMFVFCIGVIAIIFAMLYMGFRTTPAKTPADDAAVPVFFKRVEDAMPFPATLRPASFRQTFFLPHPVN